jgi:3-isopropylmalate/(R)-2-methylmalate dehydratase large subunit
LAVAAAILEGKKAAGDLRFIVMPATNQVYKEAIRLGYIKTFVEAGAVICHPGCGLCAGFPYGLMADNEKILITANRNFIGRMGTKNSLIYLSSPAVAAASALTGVISDPRSLV